MKSTKNKTKRTISDVMEADELESHHGRFRVTMFIDLDVLDEIRKRAADKRLPYQTFINQILREATFGSTDTEKIRKIVQEELAKKAI